MASEARQYAQRNQQGSDWFYHDKPAAPAKSAPAPADEPHEIEQAVESNDAKHDVEDASTTKNGDSPPVSTQAQMIRPKCDSNQWFKHDQTDSQECKSPRTQKEGEAYCKRDKTGSSSSWYKHDHGDEEAEGQQRPTTAGSANAARMRSESEHWYNHDGSSGENSAKKAHPGRPVSTEIHGVFHHN